MIHLLQIHEPGQTPAPHANEQGAAIGIDLGTTNTVVAFSHGGQVEIIHNAAGDALIPSVVSYDKNGVGGVGTMAQSGVVIRSIKRLMGKSADQITAVQGIDAYPIDRAQTGIIRLNVAGQSLTPIQISAEILKVAKAQAEQALNKRVDRAVITVPAYFDDAARTATRDAARIAGIDVLRLLNEPTAAAVAYGLENAAEGVYAIYDIGGGTFDVSILKLERGVFRVIATGGDTALGGDDFDKAIVEFWAAQKKINLTVDNLQSVLLLARQAKESLTTQDSWNGEQNLQLTRAEFETLAEKLIVRTLNIFSRTLLDAQLEKTDIKDIVLVGGSTRVPSVRRKLQEFFGKTPLSNLNPDTVVAAGAAIQAEALTAGSDHLLLDVLPLSLGVETYGGLVSKIIDRNTAIPCAKAQEFTTYQDGQGAMAIHVLQGERESACDCRSLAKFELHGIPSMTAGVPRILVTFTVDADGLLTVSAAEKTTGTAQRIEVKPTYGITEDEMAQMLHDSMIHGAEDMQKRLLAEARIEAERLLHAIAEALKLDGNMLPAAEYASLEKSAKTLADLLPSTSREKIASQAEALEHEFLPFAQMRLDRAIAQNLEGQKIGDVKLGT